MTQHVLICLDFQFSWPYEITESLIDIRQKASLAPISRLRSLFFFFFSSGNHTGHCLNIANMDSTRDDTTILLLLIIAMFSQCFSLPTSAPLDPAVPPSSAHISTAMFHTLINEPAVPPVAVLCVTSCDAQFWLNVILELLTL